MKEQEQTVPVSGVGCCVRFCLGSLVPLERCEMGLHSTEIGKIVLYPSFIAFGKKCIFTKYHVSLAFAKTVF